MKELSDNEYALILGPNSIRLEFPDGSEEVPTMPMHPHNLLLFVTTVLQTVLSPPFSPIYPQIMTAFAEYCASRPQEQLH